CCFLDPGAYVDLTSRRSPHHDLVSAGRRNADTWRVLVNVLKRLGDGLSAASWHYKAAKLRRIRNDASFTGRFALLVTLLHGRRVTRRQSPTSAGHQEKRHEQHSNSGQTTRISLHR